MEYYLPIKYTIWLTMGEGMLSELELAAASLDSSPICDVSKLVLVAAGQVAGVSSGPAFSTLSADLQTKYTWVGVLRFFF